MNHPFLADLKRWHLEPYAHALQNRLAEGQRGIESTDRKARAYHRIVDRLPAVRPSVVDLGRDWIRVGRPDDLSAGDRDALVQGLRGLIPWRKGPFEIFGLRVNAEWCSHLKWNRLVAHLADLKGRRVLDIGSSSGYYLFRMHTAAPQLVIGLEPYLTFYFQFLALQRYVDAPRLFTLPLRLETLPVLDAYFDTVFCMGILYHQRDPHAVLGRIGRLLRAGGELVLENLILEGEGDALLSPPARYAKMNNVYTVPTVARITKWLHRAGFGRIRCVDVTSTTSAEQRRTEWMPFESLADYLDPDDSRRTVEGHPAPVRAIILAERR